MNLILGCFGRLSEWGIRGLSGASLPLLWTVDLDEPLLGGCWLRGIDAAGKSARIMEVKIGARLTRACVSVFIQLRDCGHLDASSDTMSDLCVLVSCFRPRLFSCS